MLGVIGQVNSGPEVRCRRRSLLQVDMNSGPQHRQPAASDQEPALLSKRDSPVEETPHVGQVPPHQWQQVRRRHGRIGTGEVIDALLDTVEHLLAHIAGGNPQAQLGGLGSMVDRRIDQASKRALGVENPVEVARGVGRGSLEPGLKLMQVALASMGKLPQTPKGQSASFAELTQGCAETWVDG